MVIIILCELLATIHYNELSLFLSFLCINVYFTYTVVFVIQVLIIKTKRIDIFLSNKYLAYIQNY